MIRRFIFILTVLAVLIPGVSSGQSGIPVKFLEDSSRSVTVRTLTRNGTLYCGLRDLAAAFRMRLFENRQVQKLELRSEGFTMKFTAGNPFVIILDRQQVASPVQLPLNVLRLNEEYFAPASSCLPLLDYVLPEEITYVERTASVLVGRIPISSKFDVGALEFEEKSNGLLIRIRCSSKLPDYESWMKPIADDTWLYITIANARADVKTISATKPAGSLKKVLVFQSPTSVQLTFKIKGPVSSTELIPAEGANDILVAVHTPTEEQKSEQNDTPSDYVRERNRWKLDVVVIDAGHGVDDPGTIGVGKTKEKDVTLGVALKLGKLLEKNMRDVKVVYTRKKDEFVELYRRGQIANQSGGKLFVSIHCNSTAKKGTPVSGFEIYVLRPGKTEAALHIAERENEVVRLEEGYQQRYQQLTEENFILLTMAQSAYVKYSEQFADILRQEMGKHLAFENNGVKQAGFIVLIGASMPNVLIETGYLSNRKEEKILKSAKGQQRIAEAILNGIKRYKHEYEKSLLEGRDGDAQ